MTEIRFVLMQQRDKARHLYRLAEKCFAHGQRILIRVQDDKQAAALDEYLWTCKKDSFLPHVRSDSDSERLNEPIVITTIEQNPNNADVLVAGSPCSVSFIGQFQQVYDFAEVYDPGLAQLSRQRFRQYREQGFAPQMD